MSASGDRHSFVRLTPAPDIARLSLSGHPLVARIRFTAVSLKKINTFVCGTSASNLHCTVLLLLEPIKHRYVYSMSRGARSSFCDYNYAGGLERYANEL